MAPPSGDLLNENDKIIIEFLKSKSAIFTNLLQVQDEVWKSAEADKYYEGQKARAVVTVSEAQRTVFFNMMKVLGDKLQKIYNLIPPPAKRMSYDVLDLCMAPGGFTYTVLKSNRYAKVCAISLPPSEGGIEIYLDDWQNNPRLKVELTDLTMLAGEIGFSIPASQDNPSPTAKFSNRTLFPGQQFDLIFCDGHVLPAPDSEEESGYIARRLFDAQIAMALQKIKPAGTFVMLLHQAWTQRNLRLLEAFNQFSQLNLFKPSTCHAKRSSFYLVAKNVEPQHKRARRLLREARASWRLRTANAFGIDIPETSREESVEEEPIKDIVESFGEELVNLAEPIWTIQIDGMTRAFLRGKDGNGEQAGV
ncbi:hypothetical protein N7466_007217 [Penicillium verhagenii]|uniref:uncharacterized protein n=1 Tax=Penicillium verhagenii TaxID=1562060 RepID=UPI0025455F97|nr:uncharacterized protein N7466_007217 [Penicillium verhagenii]KAJ5928261.1 hypothetical protein N7466_007217 [Penicillium verhagenii]